MPTLINYLLRLVCLAVYAAALMQLAGLSTAGWFEQARLVAGVLLMAHTAELLIFHRQIRLYPGGFAASVVLTLLFGVLHWRPLAQQAAREAGRSPK